MSGQPNSDIPGSGTGWDQIQSGGQSLRDTIIHTTGRDPLGIDTRTPEPTQAPIYSKVPGGGATGDGSLLYPISVWLIAAFVAFHFGLFAAAFKSLWGFIELAVVIGAGRFFVSSNGVALVRMVFAVILVGAIGIGIVLFIAHQLGMMKH